MFKKNLKFIDTIVLYLAIYLLIFIWVRFYTKNLTSALILSLTIAFIFIFIVRIIFSVRRERSKEKEEKKKSAIEFIDNLSFNPQATKLPIILKLFEDKFTNLKISKNYILNEETIIFPCLLPKKADLSDIYDYIQTAMSLKRADIYIINREFDKTLIDFKDNFLKIKLHLIDSTALYEMHHGEAKYEKTLDAKKKKHTFKEVFKIAFNRKRAKSYILAAIFLLLASFLTPYKLYYLISCTILVILGIICLFGRSSDEESA